jgi:uncharacterized protein (DUF433 family)
VSNPNSLKLDIYGGRDPREIPAYRVTDAASYLGIPVTTLRAWGRGMNYRQKDGTKGYFRPVFSLPDPERSLLSYFNLVEAFVLSSLRKKHLIKLFKIRTAIDSLQTRFNSAHPLAEHEFRTNGVDLFIEEYGELINLSHVEQLTMREVLEAYLTHVEHDPAGRAAKLYPFIRLTGTDQPRNVVINPYVSFGKPVIAGTGLPTRVVAERFKAGDPVAEIAADYGRKEEEIDDAIRYELRIA